MWLTRVRVRMFGGNARQKVGEIERRVQRDEGQRGIKEILLPVGELYAAASSLIPKRKIAILTGFPCLLDFTPPTETDGPLGAVAIAKTLLAAGKEVVILTDECNEEPMLATVAGAGLSNPLLTLESFPARNNFDDDDFGRLEALSRSLDAVIAIERSGPAADGICRTMRGFDMNHLVAPLELLLSPPGATENGEDEFDSLEPQNLSLPLTTIGIGDGGNEVGMGKIYDTITGSLITNAQQIACTVAADHLLVCSVSNWGGYALAAAFALVTQENQATATSLSATVSRDGNGIVDLEWLQNSLPSEEEQRQGCVALVAAGARDGITKTQELFIDGMPLETSLLVLREIREIALGDGVVTGQD